MALSVKDSVKQWVRETSIAPSEGSPVPGNASILLRLYDECLSLASSLSPYIENYAESSSITPGGFTDDVANLHIWGEALCKSDLKGFYDDSEDLRNTSLEILSSLGNVLTDPGLHNALSSSSMISANETIAQRKFDLKALIQEGQQLLIEGDDLESLSGLSENTEDEDVSSTVSLESTLDFIHSLIRCLMRLLPVIERFSRHTTNTKPAHHGEDINAFELSAPALLYVQNIRDRFVAADDHLTARLGEANWQRYQRIRTIPVVSKSNFQPSTKFHDSALGTSTPAQSSYSQTVASHSSFASTLSQKESGTPRVPPTPVEVFDDVPFNCEICHQNLTNIKSRIDWKLHIFEDLQPYICTFSDCEDNLITFKTRKEWGKHEFTKHRADTVWRCLQCAEILESVPKWQEHLKEVHGTNLLDPQIQLAERAAKQQTPKPIHQQHCPLCLEHPAKTQRDFVSHLGRHLEGIALTVLPKDDGSEFASNSEGSLQGDIIERNELLPATSGKENKAFLGETYFRLDESETHKDGSPLFTTDYNTTKADTANPIVDENAKTSIEDGGSANEYKFLKCPYIDGSGPCLFDRERNLNTNTLKAFCTQHLQCSIPECSRQKHKDSDSCARHTCLDRDCRASLSPSESPGYCTLHRCTIETVEQNPACQFPKARKPFGNTLNELQYCLIHNCKFEGPRGPCEEKSDGRVYCVTHRCSSPGCDHIKLMDHDTTHATRSIQFCNCHSLQAQPIQEQKEKPVPEPVHIQEETQELGPERGIGRRFWSGRS